MGEATERGPVRRSGAKAGDWLFVTGPLGGSILGHHFDFTPRVREALSLHEAVELHALIDISDGLAADLNHILEESRCGAVLVAESIPVSDAANELSRTSGRRRFSTRSATARTSSWCSRCRRGWRAVVAAIAGASVEDWRVRGVGVVDRGTRRTATARADGWVHPV